MLLNGIIILGREPYQTYFSYSEVMSHLDRDIHEYLDMVKDYFGSQTSADNMLIRHISTYLPMQQLPEAIDGVDWLTEDGHIRQDLLDSHARTACLFAASAPLVYPALPGLTTDTTELRRTFLEAVSGASHNFTLRFNARAALETELLLYLHIQADQPVSADARQCYCSRINKLCFDDHIGDIFSSEEAISSITIPEGTAALELPLYTAGDGKLSVARLINESSEPVHVTLAGSTVSRTLQSGEYTFVIRKAGAFVDFLPIFTLRGNVCLSSCADGLRLFNVQTEEEDFLPLDTPPASWAITKENGTLLVDPSGALHAGYTQLTQTNPIIQAQASGYRHCLLTAEGVLVSNRPGPDWTDIISFAMDHTNLLAIASGRSILSTSTGASGTNAMRACVHGSHFLWLNAEGCVHSDAGIETAISNPASAIALCEAGYVIALPKEVIAFDFSGNIITRHATASPIEDMAADGCLCVLRDPTSGDYVPFCLTK